MSEEQHVFNSANEGTLFEYSTESTASSEIDFVESPLLMEPINEVNQLSTPSVSTQMEAVGTVAENEQTPLKTLKCVHCERIRANVRIFTCKGGHLICAKCVQFPTEASFHLLPRCPHCDEDAESNTNAEDQIDDLLVKCQFCQGDFKNLYLLEHERDMCHKRPVSCKYKIGGCNWHGIAAEQLDHEDDCAVQHRTGAELMPVLETSSEQQSTSCQWNSMLMLLSQTYCELINIRLLNKSTLMQYGEEKSVFYYESSVFSAANLIWFIKAKMVERQNQTPILEYALKMTSCIQPNSEHIVFYAALGGAMQLKPFILEHKFHTQSTETSYERLVEFDAKFTNFEAPITFRLMLSMQ